MRKRWLAGLAGASILVLGTIHLIQKAKGRDQPSLAFQDRGSNKAKQWRSTTGPLSKEDPPTMPSPVADLPGSNPSGIGDDPVGTVESFLQRNRKEADDSIKALTQEAETLRARLQKVEAALGRWQVIAGALNQESKPPQGESQGITLPSAKYMHDDVKYFNPPSVPKLEEAGAIPERAKDPEVVPPPEVKPPDLPTATPSLPTDPLTVPSQPLPPATEPPPSPPGIPPHLMSRRPGTVPDWAARRLISGGITAHPGHPETVSGCRTDI